MDTAEEIVVPEHLEPDAKGVFRALADLQWDFRTIDGIARETGLAPSKVAKILEEYPDQFRKSLVSDRSGRTLYTLVARPTRWQERLATLRAFATKST